VDFGLLLSNLANPPVLFFFLGMIAAWVKSDLEIPSPAPKLFSLYLLLAIGFKGGVELNKSGFGGPVLIALATALVMALVTPFYAYAILRRRLDRSNAAAISAAYGSVSAVTFIAAVAFLGNLGIESSGWMVAAMALMESPAIVIGVLLSRLGGEKGGAANFQWNALLREAFFNGSVVILVGSLIIGLLTGHSGEVALSPFTQGIFKGVLCLFLLDLGLVSARRLAASKELRVFHVGFATLLPLLNAAIGIGISALLGLSRGDALLFTVLCASASYIAVPAAMRLAVPQANPGLYVTMALALTFPFNIVIGLPLYLAVINRFWS
jgi:hypothetical protein